jgi:hypothetical protein
MEISRTGQRTTALEKPEEKARPNHSEFAVAANSANDSETPIGRISERPEIAAGDLLDPVKKEKLLTNCLAGLLTSTSHQLGLSVSEAQKQQITTFLAADPLLRSKILSYLKQLAR